MLIHTQVWLNPYKGSWVIAKFKKKKKKKKAGRMDGQANREQNASDTTFCGIKMWTFRVNIFSINEILFSDWST